jgi:hypothetical protein
MPDLSKLLASLQSELKRVKAEAAGLERTIRVLRSLETSNEHHPKARPRISAAGRARIVAAQRARWAKVQRVQASPSSKPKRKMSQAARRKIAAAQRARWAKWKTSQSRKAA